MSVFIVEDESRERFVMFKTTDGRVALLVFRDPESATAWMKSKGMESNHRVREVTKSEAADWFLNAKKQGVHWIGQASTDAFDESNVPIGPIDALIVRIDMES